MSLSLFLSYLDYIHDHFLQQQQQPTALTPAHQLVVCVQLTMTKAIKKISLFNSVDLFPTMSLLEQSRAQECRLFEIVLHEKHLFIKLTCTKETDFLDITLVVVCAFLHV
jgi:hypothetical protein